MSQAAKKRLLRLCLITAALGIAALLYLFLFSRFGIGVPCMFHRLTGLSCPGCGGTRAMAALLMGQWKQALQYNPLILLYLAYGAWFFLSASVRYVRGDEDPLFFGPAFIHIVMLAIVLIFGGARILIPLFS